MPLTHGYVPTETDILCGKRGNANSKHPGNQRFALKIRGDLIEYANGSSRFSKSLVVTTVVDALLHIHGMRFIKFNPEINRFVELSSDQAHAKVGHAIRDQIKYNGHNGSRLSMSSSLPSSLLATSRSGSVSSTMQQTLQQRHLDMVPRNSKVHIIDPIAATAKMANKDEDQIFGPSRSSLFSSQVPQRDGAWLLSGEESDIATSQDEFQLINQRVAGLSRLLFQLGKNVEEIKSNNLAARPEDVASSMTSSRLQANNQPRLVAKSDNGVASPEAARMASSCPLFAPLPMDSETTFEAQDMEELHDLLGGQHH
jgi:hypothetical protein